MRPQKKRGIGAEVSKKKQSRVDPADRIRSNNVGRAKATKSQIPAREGGKMRFAFLSQSAAGQKRVWGKGNKEGGKSDRLLGRGKSP